MLRDSEAQLLLEGKEGCGGQTVPHWGHTADGSRESPQQRSYQRRRLFVCVCHPVWQVAAHSLPKMYPSPARRALNVTTPESQQVGVLLYRLLTSFQAAHGKKKWQLSTPSLEYDLLSNCLTSCGGIEGSLDCCSLHSNEAFALEGLGLTGIVAEQVAALAPVAGQEVQLAPASQEGCRIYIQVVVILQQHA